MDGELLYEAWERYKALLMKTAEEAQNLIHMVANNQYFFTHQRQRQPSQRKGVLEFEGVDTILAQTKQMHQQLQQQMEIMDKKIDGLQSAAVNTQSQPQTAHRWNKSEESLGTFNYEKQCPEQAQYMNNTSSSFQHNFHGDAHKAPWKTHSNSRWGEHQNQGQRDSNSDSLSNTNNQSYSSNNINQFKNPQNTHYQSHNNSQNHQNNSSTSTFHPQNNSTNSSNNFQPQPSHFTQPQPNPDTQRISSMEMMMEKLIRNQEAARKDQEMASKDQQASIRNLERHMEQMDKQIVEMGEKQSNASPSATRDHPRDKGKATK
ncbi:uncharacterized protein LOC107461333 [Arachis duranensis]|uniref:Uncharacterized protein LOC107461333 n=1 Tax=Arachis duranensis TaxID=130453 RepID=A0A6P4B7X4_ARADU|nr:uncharacterized protein LOC107461333 [Arachis duranensis]